jgi:outer membrane murein-binding lipoprotein Lpp
MNKKIIALSALIVAMLFVISIAGTIFYYNGVVSDKNSKIELMNSQIANLNSQISDLKSQVANLNGQITNLTSANLVTALGITEVQYNSGHDMTNPAPFNHLYIAGSVTNMGEGTAYNAGLHVVAYDANGGLVINMTVPLAYIASFGTNAETVAYALEHYGGRSSLQLGSLLTTQTADIDIQIFHEGNASNWNITPVWTNSP